MLEIVHTIPHAATGQRIAVVGTGYVGLTAAAGFAWLGHDVVCADISTARVEMLRSGQIPIVEPGLTGLVQAAEELERLRYTSDNVEAVKDADFVFLCLPTPDRGDGRVDLSFVLKVAAEIGPHLRSGAVVVDKSTVPVGTARLVAEEVDRADIEVVSNPEFLAEGTAVADFMNPDRIVVGSDSPTAAARVAALYDVLDAPVVVTDVASAEMIKYASNAFLATKLTFANSMAAVCESVGADIRDVTRGMGADRRIGDRFLSPGPGWGGSCFPKDTMALVATARDFDAPFALLESAVAANHEHRNRIVAKVERALRVDIAEARIAVWGQTFKAGTDDVRESPARDLALTLSRLGADVRAFDPVAPIDSAVARCDTPLEACEGAHLLLVATEWPQFAAVDLAAVAEVMADPIVVDARNLLDQHKAHAAGLHYEGLGIRTLPVALNHRASDRVSS